MARETPNAIMWQDLSASRILFLRVFIALVVHCCDTYRVLRSLIDTCASNESLPSPATRYLPPKSDCGGGSLAAQGSIVRAVSQTLANGMPTGVTCRLRLNRRPNLPDSPQPICRPSDNFWTHQPNCAIPHSSWRHSTVTRPPLCLWLGQMG